MKEASGLLASTGSIAKSCVLATFRATGMATALCQDSVMAACKGAAVVATRTSGLLASSARFLNPFKRPARPAKPAKSRLEQPEKLRMRPKAQGELLAEERSGAMPTIQKLEQEAARLTEQKHALEEKLAETETAFADVREAAVHLLEELPREEPVAVPAVEERKSEKKPVARDEAREAETSKEEPAIQPDAEADVVVDARELGAAAVASGPPFPKVSLEEMEAAEFAAAVEKVVFRRALSDLESPDETLRVEGARAMGGMQHELSVRALAGCFSHEPSPRVREECVNALGRLGRKTGLPAVERALADGEACVRLAAVRGTYRLGGRGGVVALLARLGDENEDVRRRAATCLGWLGGEGLAGELLPLVADRSASVRCAALEALGNLRSRQVVAEVIERLDDPQESVRKKALDALRAITGKQMTKKVPKDDNSRQRLMARWRAWWEEEPCIGGTD